MAALRLPVATRKRGRPKENKGYFNSYHKQAKKKRLERNDLHDRLEEEASILNEEAEAIAREEETWNNNVFISFSPADKQPAGESFELVASASGSLLNHTYHNYVKKACVEQEVLDEEAIQPEEDRIYASVDKTTSEDFIRTPSPPSIAPAADSSMTIVEPVEVIQNPY